MIPDTTIDLPEGGHTFEGVLTRNLEPADRFRKLGDDAAAKAAEHEGALRAHEHTMDAMAEAKSDHAHLTAVYGHFKLRPGSREAAELASAAEAVERAKAIVKDRTSPALQRATDRAGNAAEVLANARRFLAGKKTEDKLKLRRVSVEVPASFADAIAAKTTTIAARKLRRGGVATALPPADSIKRTLRNRIADAAARGEPEVTGLYDGGRNIGFSLPMMMLENAEPNKFRPTEQPRIVDVEAIVCRYFGDKIIADLEAQIDAEYQGEIGDEVMDASEKRALLAALDKEIDQLQRELAELIWLARDAGEDVEFPVDLPAAAVLGVAA